MNIEIHQLQKLSPKLLTALYAEKDLPPTDAILAIGNNYYPSIEQILDTLHRYRDVDIVITFVNENAATIEAAKEQIEKAKLEAIAQKNAAQNGALENEMDIPDAQALENSFKELRHRPLKTVSIEQIESAISKALLELLGQGYEVDVKRLDFDSEFNEFNSDDALLDLRLKRPFNPLIPF